MADALTPIVEGEPITGLVLTPEQRHKWGDTMSLMVWTCPGFRHLFYKLLANNSGEYVAVFTKTVPIAATDGKNILLNPDTFFALSLKERVFVVAHEIIHNVYDDVNLLHRLVKAGTVPTNKGKTLPFDMNQFQMAMDYRINAILKASRVGEMPKVGCFDQKISATGVESVLDIYEKIYKKQPTPPPGQGGFDVILSPGASTGQSPNQAQQQRNAQQWAVEVAAAKSLEEMLSQGKMAGALQRMFQDILEPEVPWTEHIRTEISRRVGSGSYDWRRPDRRFIVRDIHLPGRSGHGAGWLVVWGDTSGSIGKDELERYLGELSGIIDDVRPKRLTILWGDTKVCHVDEVQDANDLLTIKSRGVGGGGGTRVMLAFDWMAQEYDAPDMFIGFTDGYCEPFPKHMPTFPVIWASTTDKQYPWGEVVRINPKRN